MPTLPDTDLAGPIPKHGEILQRTIDELVEAKRAAGPLRAAAVRRSPAMSANDREIEKLCARLEIIRGWLLRGTWPVSGETLKVAADDLLLAMAVIRGQARDLRAASKQIAAAIPSDTTWAARKDDSSRLDWLELIIRDGSYRSILNDIIAVCEHSYATFGPGPTLRSVIDIERLRP